MSSSDKKMRIKSVGGTINLGSFSSLRVELGEQQEFAGLELDQCVEYLKNIATTVGGTIDIPDNVASGRKTVKKQQGVLTPAYNGGKVFFDEASHSYVSQDGVAYESVTRMLDNYYKFDADNIKHEYMDFAINYGNLIHCAIQNSLIGKQPKSQVLKSIIEKTLDAMHKTAGEWTKVDVEEILIDQEHLMAGRFDILTYNDDDKKDVKLWDVKTNTDIFRKDNNKLPKALAEEYAQYWGVDTVYGHYCLQLNIYAWILENVYGKNVTDMYIIHIPDEFGRIVPVKKTDITGLIQSYMDLKHGAQ